MQFATTLFTASAPTAASPALAAVTGGLTAFGSYVGGIAEQQGLNTQAAYSDLQAEEAQIQGTQQANTVRQKILETLAQNRAAAGAGGLNPNVGSVANQMVVTQAKGRMDINTIMSGAGIRAESLRLRAAGLRGEARAAYVGGIINAGGGLLSDAYKANKRGSIPAPSGQTGVF